MAKYKRFTTVTPDLIEAKVGLFGPRRGFRQCIVKQSHSSIKGGLK